MNGLRPVLKQRVHALHGTRVREAARRIDVGRGGRDERHVAFREKHDSHKRNEHEARHEQRHTVDGLIVLHHAHGDSHVEGRNEPCPQQQRALAAGPQAREAIEHAERAFRFRMLEQHVFDGEVARHEAENEQAAAERERDERENVRHSARPRERVGGRGAAAAAKRLRNKQAHRANGHAREGDDQAEQTKSRHALTLLRDVGSLECARGFQRAGDNDRGAIGDAVGKRAVVIDRDFARGVVGVDDHEARLAAFGG